MKVRGPIATPISIALALGGTLFFAFIVFQFGFICSPCLNPPNAHYVSWLMFGLILLSPVAYLVALLGRRSNNYHHASTHSRKWHLLFVVAMGLVSSLTALRFIVESTPQGSDTPNYLYVSNIVLEKGSLLAIMGDGRELTFLFLAGLRLLVEEVFRQPFQLSMIIFPILLSNIMALAVFQLVRNLTRDYGLAVASMALSGFSFFLIRMSYDLFAQMFGISILLLLFSSLPGALAMDATRNSLIRIALLSAMLTLAHTYTWILGMVILTFYLFTSYFEGIGPRLKPALAAILPGIIYFGLVRLTSSMVLGLLPGQWYERTLATPSVVQGLVFPFKTGSFSPLSLSFLSDTTVGFENPLILTAAAFGALAILRPDREQSLPRLLFSWTASLVLLLLLGFSQEYRLIILLPVGILAGYAASRASRFDVEKLRRVSKLPLVGRLPRKAAVEALVMLLVICLAFSLSVPRAFAPQYVYYPNKEGVQQLLLVRNLFGFGNPRLLVLVEDPGSVQNSFQWARAITGAYVYLGSVTDLVHGKPFLLAGIIPIRPNLNSIDMIVIPSALYPVGSFETGIFREENGLYITTPDRLLALVA